MRARGTRGTRERYSYVCVYKCIYIWLTEIRNKGVSAASKASVYARARARWKASLLSYVREWGLIG